MANLILKPELDRIEHTLGIQIVVPAGTSKEEAQKVARAQWDTGVRHMKLQGFDLEKLLGIKGPYPYVAPADFPQRPMPSKTPRNREKEYRKGLGGIATNPTLDKSDYWEFRIWATWSRMPFVSEVNRGN